MPPAIPRGFLPGDQIDYVEKNSNTNITGTTGATATTVLTGNEVTYDGNTRIMLEFYSPSSNVSSGFLDIVLYDGSTELGVMTDQISGQTIKSTIFLTPSAGKHTYVIKAYGNSGTRTVYGGTGAAGNYYPAFMRITRA